MRRDEHAYDAARMQTCRCPICTVRSPRRRSVAPGARLMRLACAVWMVAIVLAAAAQTSRDAGGAGAPAGPADARAEALQWLEQGRQARRAGDAYAALAAFARARQLQPADAEIAQALADALVDIGAPTAAADALGPRTDIGLRSRLAAQRLRWAIEIAPRSPDPARRFDDVDRAIAVL